VTYFWQRSTAQPVLWGCACRSAVVPVCHHCIVIGCIMLSVRTLSRNQMTRHCAAGGQNSERRSLHVQFVKQREEQGHHPGSLPTSSHCPGAALLPPRRLLNRASRYDVSCARHHPGRPSSSNASCRSHLDCDHAATLMAVVWCTNFTAQASMASSCVLSHAL
jgi:hypothetical protein